MFLVICEMGLEDFVEGFHRVVRVGETRRSFPNLSIGEHPFKPLWDHVGDEFLQFW